MLKTLIAFLASHAIAALMLSTGLMTSKAVVKSVRERWPLLLRAMAVVWLVVPVFAFAIATVFELAYLPTAIVLLLAICPGVPLVVRSTTMAKGSVGTALMVLLTTAVTATVLIPLWSIVLVRFTQFDFIATPMDVLRVTIPSVILPFIIGRLIRMLSPRVADPLAKIANVLFMVGIVLLGIVLISKSYTFFDQASWRGYVTIILVTLGAAAIGYAAGGPRREDRTSVAYAAALGNPALALAIAAHTAPGASVLPLVAIYVLVRLIALVPVGLWFKYRSRHASPPMPHDPGMPHDPRFVPAR